MTLDDLLTKWLNTQGGAERANYQMFLTEFAQAMDLPRPHPKGMGLGDYEFEAPVRSEAVLGGKGTGRIDLYKRDCFILEAKQSRLAPGEAVEPEPAAPPPVPVVDLFGHVTGYETTRPLPRYDRLMADARLQAERYALALPATHRAPPFLIVADIGRAFEVYFDWAGNGRGYAPFPDERGYRVLLEDLRDPAIAARMRGIWDDPPSVDPRLKAAAVTRDVAERLSKVATELEKDARSGRDGDVNVALGIEATALFLMRMLFCMFAEDVELLPRDSFKRFLSDAQDRSALFWRAGLTELWSRMDDAQEINRFWSHGDAIVRYFNGNLFTDKRVFNLGGEAKRELLIAAGKDWRAVEPAIFGTLLEQVLTASDRAKLGAHYTPRAYVERLVDATMMEPLRADWDAVFAAARVKADAGDAAGAVADARAFHATLAALRVLDPACGTGNFLYVAMEQLLRLEGEVGRFAAGLGETLTPAVGPNQFLGLELNPRAAVIAELVLWIGWLRYRLANTPEAIGEPVLPTLNNINFGTHGGYDAVLVRTATGAPDTENPQRPDWPPADFIVGNPPFIGGKNMRSILDTDQPGYVETLWRANPRVPKSADLVMQWWDRAADILTRPGTRLRRFGFVTTNSITQVFSRRVIEGWLDRSSEDRRGLHLVLAIADHPWTRVTRDAAAVRIAMTVAEAGAGEGRLIEITGERALDTDAPMLDETRMIGTIHADLSVGTDVTRVVPLRANEGLASRGVQLMGAGFIVSREKARDLGLGRREGLEQYIREYRNGRDLLQRARGAMVIDVFGLSENEVMDRFPEVYDHLLGVRTSRAAQVKKSPTADAKAYLAKWWIFGKPRTELRPALAGLSRYIATTETSKHRIFQFVDEAVMADNMIVVVASDAAWHLGVLSSSLHCLWAADQGGTLEDRPRWSKSLVFDPFPFPDPTFAQREAIGALAERLDKARREALAENPALTMTGLYNLVAEARGAAPLSAAREDAVVKARARIVAKLHDDLDAAVAAAYGWPADLGATEIVARLAALNAARAVEEAAGHVRWLRPDYQRPRFSRAGDADAGEAATVPRASTDAIAKPA